MSRERNLDPNASPLAFLGAELRRCRKRAGLSQPQLSELTSYSTSMISKIERAQRPASRDFAYECDRVFDLDGHFARLYQFMLWAPGPSWFTRWLEEIEPGARVLRYWAPLLVPGLLQTEAYARHIFGREPDIGRKEIDERVQARMQRQAILANDDSPTVWVLIDEGLLHRPLGGPEVMCRQMDRLLNAAACSKVTIQVVPYCAESPVGLTGPFIIAELQEGQPDAVFLDSSTVGEVTTDHERVASIWRRYDAIRADAYPQHLSLEMIREARDRWDTST